MKRFILIFACTAAIALAQNVGTEPILKYSSGPNKGRLTSTLVNPDGTDVGAGGMLFGTAVPTTEGANGNAYLRYLFGTLYTKSSGSWTLSATYVLTGDSRMSDTRTPTDASVTAAKIDATLKPSGSASAGTEALRALGTSSGTAAAGNDSRIVNAVPNTITVNGHALSANVTVTNADLGAVPTSTTVAGHALSSNVTIADADLSTSDVTTNNASISKHGFLPKLDNNSAHYLNGQGGYTTPAGGGDALTSGTLGQFAPTSSSALAGVLNDEVGSGGGFTRATGATHTTATLAGETTLTGTTVRGSLDTIAITSHAGPIDATKGDGSATDSAACTLTMSSDSTTARTYISRDLINSSGAAIVFTLKNAAATTIAAITVPASSTTPVTLRSTGTAWTLYGGATSIADLTSGTPAAADLFQFSQAGLAKQGALSALFAITHSPSNETLDTASTNTIKRFDYAQFIFPEYGDGTNAVRVTTEGATYGHFTFANGTAKASNYVIYTWRVPDNIDTAIDLKAAFKFILGGADTGKHSYYISMYDAADSAAVAAPTFINEVALSFAGDASGASGDVESVAFATLTSWKGSMTAGHYMKIKVARDGNDGTLDTSTVNSTDANLTIRFGISSTSTQ